MERDESITNVARRFWIALEMPGRGCAERLGGGKISPSGWISASGVVVFCSAVWRDVVCVSVGGKLLLS